MLAEREIESTEREIQSTWNFWDSNPEFYIVRYSWHCKLLGPQWKSIPKLCSYSSIVQQASSKWLTLSLSITDYHKWTNCFIIVSSATSPQVQELFVTLGSSSVSALLPSVLSSLPSLHICKHHVFASWHLFSLNWSVWSCYEFAHFKFKCWVFIFLVWISAWKELSCSR